MWSAREIPREFVSAEFLYDVSRKHGLLQERPSATVSNLLQTARDGQVYAMYQGVEHVATMIVSRITEGWAAEVDMIPVRKWFRGNQGANLRRVVRPIILDLMEEYRLLRLTSWVPASRARAARALEECGFVREGTMRLAVQLDGHAPEDLVILGFVRE
jgi:hypothetical protein